VHLGLRSDRLKAATTLHQVNFKLAALDHPSEQLLEGGIQTRHLGVELQKFDYEGSQLV
jgi:hypothetical protein